MNSMISLIISLTISSTPQRISGDGWTAPANSVNLEKAPTMKYYKNIHSTQISNKTTSLSRSNFYWVWASKKQMIELESSKKCLNLILKQKMQTRRIRCGIQS